MNSNVSSKFSLESLLNYRQQFCQKVEHKFPNLINNLYLICLGVYFTSTLIKNSSMPGYIINQRQLYLLAIIPSIFVLLKIFIFDKNSLNDLLIFSLLECVLFVMGKNAANFNIFYFGIFIYGAKNVDFDRIIKVFLLVNILGTFISMILAFANIIPNVIAIRSLYSPIARYSLGSVYPTNMAARIFSTIVAYVALRKFKLSIPEYISLFAITFWTYVVTDTRLDLILMLLVILLVAFYKPISKLMAKISYKMINILTFGYIGIILALGYLFCVAPHNPILQFFNGLLSGRLAYEAHAISNFSIKPFGQYVPQPGNGHFFIDSIYFRIPLMYGVPLILIFIILVLALNKRLQTKSVFYLELCFLLFIISGGIDQHFFESCYNFIVLALFAKIPGANPLERKKIYYEN